MKINALIVCGIFLLFTQCSSSPDRFDSFSFNDPSLSQNVPLPADTIFIESVALNVQDTLTLEIGQTQNLALTEILLNNGKKIGPAVQKLKSEYLHLNQDVVWFINNTSVATINNGVLSAVGVGTTTLQASLANQTDSITIIVKEKPSEQTTNTPTESENSNENPSEEQPETTDETTTENESEPQPENGTEDPEEVKTSSVVVSDFPKEISVNSSTNLVAKVTHENQTYQNVTTTFTLPSGKTKTITWSSSDPAIASISNTGVLSAHQYGLVTITVAADDVSHQVNIAVKMNAQKYEVSNHFITSDETVVFSAGSEGGYGYNEKAANPFDSIVGEPNYSLLDVLSLGHGGSVMIELAADKEIVDGEGVDFIVFENAFFANVNDPLSAWIEPAQVAVSDNGEEWYSYDCDAFDADEDNDFTKCAGIQVIKYSDNPEDYLNHEITGGDAFDLADFNLPAIRFIKITDQKTCISSAILCGGSSRGFDLDAISFPNILKK